MQALWPVEGKALAQEMTDDPDLARADSLSPTLDEIERQEQPTLGQAMIEFWVKAWLILAVVFTVLYLITMLVAGPEKTKSLIFALMPALLPLPLLLPWPSLFTGLLLLRLIEPFRRIGEMMAEMPKEAPMKHPETHCDCSSSAGPLHSDGVVLTVARPQLRR